MNFCNWSPRKCVETERQALRVPDCNFRESLAKLEKSKLLIICLKFTFGELSSKILFECSGNFQFSRILEKTK